jgi:tetratricopeptide (TPR) repeat protein
MPPDNDVHKEIEQLEQRFAENSKGLVFAHLADAYRRAGDYAKAEGLVLHGLQGHPNYISAYNVLGRVYLDSERFSDAHEQFSKVLELDPQNLVALRALGDLALRGGRLDDAQSWYERMLQIDPRNAAAQEALDRLESGDVPPPDAAAAAATAGSQAPAAEVEATLDAVEMIPLDTAELVVEEPATPETLQEAAGGEAKVAEDVEPVEIEPVKGLIGEKKTSDAEPVEGLISGRGVAIPEDEDELGVVDELVEGLVPGEAMSAEASEESAPAEEAGPAAFDDAVANTMPWEVPDLAALPGEPPADKSLLEGFPSAEPPVEETPEGTPEFDLNDMEDWTPGFLREDDLSAERGAALGGEAATDDLGGEFSLDLGEDVTGEEIPDSSAGPEAEGEVVVTETMAELYADQGLFEDAIGVYRKLAKARPADERIAARIEELEQQLEEDRASHSAGFELAELLELTEPHRGIGTAARGGSRQPLGRVRTGRAVGADGTALSG